MAEFFQSLFPGPFKHSKAEYGMVYEKDDGTKGVRRAPFFLNPFSVSNAGVLISYFDVGLSANLWSTPIAYYLVTTLDIDATQYSAFSIFITLPWSLKFFFGLLIDGVSILEYRRKSWLIVGWVSYVCVALWLWDLATPSFTYCVALCFLLVASYLLADVCNDTLSVERARYEPQDIRGGFQTSGQIIRALGGATGAILGALLYNTSTWGWGLTIGEIFLLAAFIPLTGILPLSWNLIELQPLRPPSPLYEQLQTVWQTVQMDAVWRTMLFIYIYNIFQVPNSSWTNFLIDGLGFSDFDIGMLTFVAAACHFVGIIIFRQFFFATSWRLIYIFTTLVGSFLLIGSVSNG